MVHVVIKLDFQHCKWMLTIPVKQSRTKDMAGKFCSQPCVLSLKSLDFFNQPKWAVVDGSVNSGVILC